MTRAIIYSLVICALGAALEGLFAGRGIKQRLANIRLPVYAVPFWGWMVIGGIYYVICFAILYRLFLLPPIPGRSVAFVLLGAIMFINALWNYFFFRTGNLFHAYLLGLPYGAIALSLFLFLLLRVDRTAAWCLLPYILYLFYANIWGYRLWKLNPRQ
ncbi:MAG TPA: TspO/MBR family protein [Chthoniobacterales bacterium]|nr:TspO/MBR family protein [Chthoniobacterales bacterium]